MKIKLNTFKIIKSMIYACVVLNGYYAYYFGIPLKSPYPLTVLIIFVMVMCLFLKCGRRCFSYYESVFSKGYILLFIILSIEIVYSMSKYNQSFYEVFVCFQHFFYLLLCIPITYVMMNDNFMTFLDGVSTITSLTVFLRLLQATLFNIYGIVVFPLLIEYGRFGTRNNNIRIDVTGMCCFSTIWIFYRIQTSNQKRLFFVILLISNLTAYVYMNQSRLGDISIALSLVLMIYYKKKRGKRALFALISFILICIIVAFTDVIPSFLNTFSISSKFGGGSTMARLITLKYYYSSPYRNPILGMGLINDGTSERYLILHRTFYNDQAFFSDLGLIGAYFNLGVLGIMIYLYIFFRLFKAFVFAVKNDKTYTRMLAVGFFVYYILSSVTSLMFVPSLIIGLPFMWAVSEYYLNCVVSKEWSK